MLSHRFGGWDDLAEVDHLTNALVLPHRAPKKIPKCPTSPWVLHGKKGQRTFKWLEMGEERAPPVDYLSYYSERDNFQKAAAVVKG